MDRYYDEIGVMRTKQAKGTAPNRVVCIKTRKVRRVETALVLTADEAHCLAMDLIRFDHALLKEEGQERCSICHSTFTGYGNNPEPVAPGRCCDACNAGVVIPTRIRALNGGLEHSDPLPPA